MILYLDKYQKYKKKYLNLLNEINQYGGEPNTLILKDFDLFTNKKIEEYLNPIYGYILYKSEFLKNCIKYKTIHKYNSPISNFVSDCFNLNESEIKLKPNLLINIKPEDIAIFAGYWFMYVDEIYEYDFILKEIEKITKLVKDCIRNKYESIPKSNRHNVCNSLDEKIQMIQSFIYDYAPHIHLDYNDLQKSLNETLSHMNTMKKENTDTRSQKITEFNSKYSYVSSNDKINKIFNENFKYLNKDAIYPQMFYVLLAILWMISRNKNDYKKYYETLNLILPSRHQVIIPKNYESVHFEESEIYNEHADLNAKNIFFRELVKMTQITDVTIETYDYVMINGISEKYADCAETTIRNFIKILTYDSQTKIFSLEKLKLLGATSDIIEYFTVYNTDDKQTSKNKLTFKGEENNARIAWDTLISNLPNIRYKKEENGYKYEVKNGHGLRKDENNLLCVLKEIFTEINDWADFVEKGLVRNIAVVFDEDFSGNISFDSYSWNVTVSEFGGHSTIVKMKEAKLIDRKKISRKYRTYFNILTINNYYENYDNIDNWMLFVAYCDYFELANYVYTKKSVTIDDDDYDPNFIFDTKLYSALINNVTKNNTADELTRLYILYKYVSRADVKVCIQYFDDYSDFVNLEYLCLSYYDMYPSQVDNMTSDKITFNFDSIKNNYKLQKILLHEFELTKPIRTSLSKLTNLENLYLGSYNYQLDDSLSNLTNLTDLYIGNHNFLINDSFNNLTNLKKLNLHNYDHQLNYSLKNLTNLQELSLRKHNNPLNNSLETLTNLTFLDLHDYNQPLEISLNNLSALQTLLLKTYNKPLDKSLNNLTALQTLSLDSYTLPLENDLDNCTGLTTLNLNSYNIPLFNSLDKLVNLYELNLCSYDKTNLYSLDKLTNLTKLSLDSYKEYNAYIDTLIHTPGTTVVVHPSNYFYLED